MPAIGDLTLPWPQTPLLLLLRVFESTAEKLYYPGQLDSYIQSDWSLQVSTPENHLQTPFAANTHSPTHGH